MRPTAGGATVEAWHQTASGPTHRPLGPRGIFSSPTNTMSGEPIRVPPGRPQSGAIGTLWDSPVAYLVTVQTTPISPGEVERHRIYALLTLAIGRHYWNGNRHGARGDYPQRQQQRDIHHSPQDLYEGGDYHGHNIVAIAVNGQGQVVDFDFNHNALFNSSAEHAEARLLRRLFALAQLDVSPPERAQGSRTLLPVFNLPGGVERLVPATYGNLLREYTIYTSLESCAQCAGMMALAQLGRVVYLQHDPGQNYIGNILYRLSREEPNGGMLAPLPISGVELGFEYSAALDAGFASFIQLMQQNGTYFYREHPERPSRKSKSITDYLCTDDARELFGKARDELATLAASPDLLAHAEHIPQGAPGNTLTNARALEWAWRFYHYAIGKGRRGTPHH
jgi:tRNA(Arg) A34 adenosine deaminase TadA